jgi:hypothetical protein
VKNDRRSGAIATEHLTEIETGVVGNLMIIKRGLELIIIIIYIYHPEIIPRIYPPIHFTKHHLHY